VIDIGKRGPLAPITLSFGEKIAKIGPVDLEIIVLGAINKKEIKKTEIKRTTESTLTQPNVGWCF